MAEERRTRPDHVRSGSFGSAARLEDDLTAVEPGITGKFACRVDAPLSEHRGV
jgi:hypothetical protein